MRQRQKLTRFIRNTIYALKRGYGFPISIHSVISSGLDLEKGKKTTVVAVQEVKRAIELPSRLLRTFVYDLAYIASNKNFTEGGFFDIATRKIIIDKQDIPNDFEIKIQDYLVFDGKHWRIADKFEFEYDTALLLAIKYIENVPRDQIFELTIRSVITFDQEVTQC